MSYLVRLLTSRSTTTVFRLPSSFVSSLLTQSRPGISKVIIKSIHQQKAHQTAHNHWVTHHNVLRRSCLTHTTRRPSGVNVRHFRTTGPNRLPPVFWLLIRPVSKLIAVFTGRRIRLWWQRLPPDRRAYFINKLRQHKWKLFALLGAYVALCCIYYVTHLVATPLTGRIRFVAVSEEQYRKISDFEFNTQLRIFKDRLLDPSHPVCKRIRDIALHLLKANQDLEQIRDKEWTITVVDEPKIQNAFVLPNGQIFVFSGILNMTENEDQLANILAHEMSHCVLGHGAELLSHGQLLDFMVLSVIVMIWSLFPTDITAAIAHFFMSKVTDLTIDLPYSRTLETEADLIGLQMAAKACFDVREAVAFWQSMGLTEKIAMQRSGLDVAMPDHIDYLSTHPRHETRAEYLNSLIPEAIKLREECKCWRLPRRDPRDRVQKLIQQYELANDPRRNVIKLVV